MATRSKLIGPLVKSRSEAEALAGEVAGLMLDRQTRAAKMEAELQRIRDKYAADLDLLDKGVDRGTLALKDWAEANASEFGEKRSIEFAHATIGFLLHPPHVTPLPQQRNALAQVVEGIGAMPQAFRAIYLRIKTELNKDAVLEAFQRGIADAEHLRKLGVGIDRREQFYIEPKREQLEVESAKAAS